MTAKEKWKIAKWINRHGKTERKNTPEWFPKDLLGDYDFFHVTCNNVDAYGFPILSPDDTFEIDDSEIDALRSERRRKVHEFRDWLEPVGVIVATVISLISLAISLVAFFNGLPQP